MQNEERIAVLELQYRTMKRIVLGVAWVISVNFTICSLIIVGYFVSTTNAPDVIQAKSFQAVNDEGKIVAEIGAYGGGGVLGINNKEGKQIAAIKGFEEFGMLTITNNKFMEVVQISATPYGGVLDIKNKDGQSSVALGTQEDSNGGLKIFNAKGEATSQSP